MCKHEESVESEVEGSGRLSVGWGKGGRNGRRRRGRTRWEHVSHTEIVNYSFVLRRVGVGRLEERRSEYHAGRRKKGRRRGNRGGGGHSVHVHMARGRGSERREEDERRSRDATRTGESETAHSCFIGPLRPVLVTEGRVGGEVAAVRARERRKTRMRLMIYTPATVYYRLE